jgi:hypothetical protein
MEISEVVRRFTMCSFEVGGHIIMISPARHLLFKRATFFPYTYGETPWQALYDLSRFAERVDVVTTWPKSDEELRLIYKLAYYTKPPRSTPLYLYLNEDVPVLFVNKREAFDGIRLIRVPEEVERLRRAAVDIISRSKEVDIFEYDDIWIEYCRRFRYVEAMCY